MTGAHVRVYVSGYGLLITTQSPFSLLLSVIACANTVAHGLASGACVRAACYTSEDQRATYRKQKPDPQVANDLSAALQWFRVQGLDRVANKCAHTRTSIPYKYKSSRAKQQTNLLLPMKRACCGYF